MSSFVAEVLSSAEHMEREEMNEKLSVLGRRMEELKMEIHTVTTETLTSFESPFDVTMALADKVKATSNEMQELSHKIETEIKGQLNITGEFQSLTRQLEQVSSAMAILDKLTRAQQLMENISVAISKEQYMEASSSLMMLEEALKQPLCEEESEVKIVLSVRIETQVLKQNLIQTLNSVWKETVSWTCSDGVLSVADKPATDGGVGSADDGGAQQWQLKLPNSDSCAEQEAVRQMVTALESLDQLDRKIRSLGQHLAQNILSMAVQWQKVVVKESALARGKLVVVRAVGECKQPSCVSVFSVMANILDLLYDSLLHVEVQRKAEDGAQEGNVTLMNILGEEVGEKVLDNIVKECLSHAIPSSSKELETFHEVIAITQKFHDKLVGLGFITNSCRTLLDYVENVNVLFANKKCQNLLERARGLMTSDIHDTVLISSDASPGELAPLDKSGGPGKAKKDSISTDPLLGDATFRMPTCRISQSVHELVDLVYNTLNEATSSSPQCAVQMFYAVRNIFELFCSVFPTYHAHSLANFPQLTALHHNNCMLLAHHLLTLGHQFKHCLPSDVCATFVDHIPEIRSLGTSSFLQQVDRQKAILKQYMQGAAGFASVDQESNYGMAERSVKQALHQLTHLQKVWQDVLPSSVYHKAIGILLNCLFAQIMDDITALEDISSEAARKLFMLLKMVDDKGALLMMNDKDSADDKNVVSKAKVQLFSYVPKYAKFTEIQLVLNGSLQEISDRWADGQGPLAAEIPPNELKQLIRALFQNTDRRAAVLAKIK